MSSKELSIVIDKQDALNTFITEGAMDPYLAEIRAWIDALPVPDISTKKGRDEVIKNSVSVRDMKVYLKKIGKELADEQKKIPALIDKTRSTTEQTLDEWQAEVRKPVTDWEEKEKQRLDRLKGHIQHIIDTGILEPDTNAWAIQNRINGLEAYPLGPEFDEFEPEAIRAKDKALADLRTALEKRQQYEAEQAELEELRRQKAEREAKDRAEAEAKAQAEHEERIRQEAAQKAQQQAEAKAEAERMAEADRVARAQREAEERELAQKRALEKAEREKAEAEARERQAKIDAENTARETEARIKREQEAAAKREQEELERRERNKRHAAKINNEALEDLVKGGLTEEAAKIAVTLIAKKEIRNVQINY